MIGAIIGAVAGVGGSILGGIKASKAAKRAKAAVERGKAENENWWRLKSNVDYTKSADNQYALEQGRQRMNQMLDRSAGTEAVMGGTEAASAASKQAATQAMADTVEKVAANADAQRRADEQTYMQTKRNYDQQLINIENSQAQANTQAASQAMQAGLGLAVADAQAHLDNGKGLFETMFSKKKNNNTTEGE